MSSPTKTIRVLSLDGGGVRGLSSMIILEYLLRLVQRRLKGSLAESKSSEIRPSQLFDQIVGTSTGGLIAVMLVKLDMPISECIQVYKELIPEIFGRRQFGSCIGGLGVPRYPHETFTKCVQAVFDKYGKRESGAVKFMEEANLNNNRSNCTVVCRELHPSGRRMNQPAFICSHYCRTTQLDSGKYTLYELWAACRATTAAPTFFSPITIHGRTFIDGAFGNTNNPSRKAHFHFVSKVSGYKECPVIWLNIGTGSPKPHRDALSTRTRRSSVVTMYRRSWKHRPIPSIVRDARNLLRDLEAIATDSDRVEEEMEDIINSKATEQDITFAQVSANNGVADVQLDDWRGLDKIEHLTRLYLEQPEVGAKLQRMADLFAAETLRRHEEEARQGKMAHEDLPALTLPPFLSSAQDDVSPLPSPIITVSRPGRESQHTANLQGLSPLEPSPISPLTTIVPSEEPGSDLPTTVEEPLTTSACLVKETAPSDISPVVRSDIELPPGQHEISLLA